MQDQVILVAREVSMSMQDLLDMPLPSFESLHLSCLRLRAQDAREAAWTAMVAAQGTTKAMKDLDKEWVRISELDLRPEGADDAVKFLSKYGKGL